MFIGLTRLRDRKHRFHDRLELAGVNQASEHCELGSVGLDDEESVAHILIISLFRGCGNGEITGKQPNALPISKSPSPDDPLRETRTTGS